MENYLGKAFDNWVDMWEKAQNDEEFQKDSKKADSKPLDNVDFFGQQRYAGEEVDDVAASSPDSAYWKKIYQMSRHPGDAPDPLADEIITEDEKQIVNPRPVKPNLSNKDLGDVVNSKANAANPVQPSSVGKDQDYKPNLADVYQLEQLHDMKVNLHELESKLNTKASLGQTKEGQKIQGKINDLRKQIDDLSDSITPNFLQSYLS